MSLIGGMSEVTLYWAENDFRESLEDLVDRTVNVFEHGLPTRASS